MLNEFPDVGERVAAVGGEVFGDAEFAEGFGGELGKGFGGVAGGDFADEGGDGLDDERFGVAGEIKFTVVEAGGDPEPRGAAGNESVVGAFDIRPAGRGACSGEEMVESSGGVGQRRDFIQQGHGGFIAETWAGDASRETLLSAFPRCLLRARKSALALAQVAGLKQSTLQPR